MNCNQGFYSKKPICFIDDVPVFSERDCYIENYDQISGDHLAYFEKTGLNPFMGEEYWCEIEDSTAMYLKKYMDFKDVKILDVGVGMGRLLERFPGADRFGMDVSLGYLKHAKKKGIEVCMSKIEDMPYCNSYFDIVICTDVLEHVLNLNFAIEKILGTLKKNGILIIRVPYKEDLSYYLSANCPYEMVHLRSFDENSLTLLFEKIFKCKVLEYGFTGYHGGRLKFGANISFFNVIVSRFLNIIRRINKKNHFALSKRLYEPIEINLIVRNSSAFATGDYKEVCAV